MILRIGDQRERDARNRDRLLHDAAAEPRGVGDRGVEVVDADARSARVIVPDFQLSLAIGKEGQNARLAARLTGWRIDIRSDDEQSSDA